ncbi:MAG: DUF2892 domain-containing protein [Bacteroidales bacterium]|nr:DUF2892 domain-containing protein [Bacteroidales bacterium]
MKCNVGRTDKVIRIVLGLAIGAAGYFYSSWLGLIGIVPIATALINWCPLYLPFGIKTCKTEQQ